MTELDKIFCKKQISKCHT